MLHLGQMTAGHAMRSATRGTVPSVLSLFGRLLASCFRTTCNLRVPGHTASPVSGFSAGYRTPPTADVHADLISEPRSLLSPPSNQFDIFLLHLEGCILDGAQYVLAYVQDACHLRESPTQGMSRAKMTMGVLDKLRANENGPMGQSYITS